jgi:hypothetical protein
MTPATKQIEREVEASRMHVEETVDALRNKMSLGQIVDEAAHYFQGSGGNQLVSNLGAQMRDNPLPLVLVGVGLAWLMSGRGHPRIRSTPGYDPDFGVDEEYRYRRMMAEGMGQDSPDSVEREASDRRMRSVGVSANVADGIAQVADRVGETGKGVGSAASQAGHSAYSAAGSTIHSARSGGEAAWRGGMAAYDRASRLGSDAYRNASNLSSQAYHGAYQVGRRAHRSFADVLQTEPLVLGALGFAIGAAVGAFLPRTDIEDRYLSPARDRLRDEAEAFAEQKYEQAKAVARDAYKTARSEAEAQGLTMSGDQNLVEKAAEVAKATAHKLSSMSLP